MEDEVECPFLPDEQSTVKTDDVTSITSHGRKHSNYDSPPYLDPRGAGFFHHVNRYHPGDTLPPYNRTSLQVLLRRLRFDSVLFSVFGLPGSGKSSFINSIYYVMTGNYVEYCAEAKSETDNGESVTNRRLCLRVTEAINVTDNKGIENQGPVVLKELAKQCEGYRDFNELIADNWQISGTTKLKDFCKSICSDSRRLSNIVHCPILIFRLTDEMEPLNLKRIIDVLKKSCGCSPVVVMTHLDAIADPGIIQEKSSQFQALNCGRIFSLQNYTYTDHERNRNTDSTLVEILFNCCLVADQQLSDRLLKNTSCLCC